MVRFIIGNKENKENNEEKFTFQYGQIYYLQNEYKEAILKEIYIPIWLDLLSRFWREERTKNCNLHSNMVRFIIVISAFTENGIKEFTFQYGQIYYAV